MSYAYVTEPPTKGKVVMKTSLGDLEIELWPKEAPKAVRNFVQLCLEGYYDDTVFHRIVKDFIVQAGDPTGQGTGGESIYPDGPFADEFHSRLRFSHRGILAMANTGRHSNTSQFFFTLNKTEELNKKNTIFGKIVGDTIFNLLKIGDAETDSDEKPIYPIKIISIDVLHNPFDDIEPRTTAAERRSAVLAKQQAEERAAMEAKKVKGKKNLNLLSFGMEAESEESLWKTIPSKKIASSHDLLNDDRLSKDVVVKGSSPTYEKNGSSKTQTDQHEQQETASVKRKWEDESEESDSEDLEYDKTQNGTSTFANTTGSAPKSKGSLIKSEIEKVQNELRLMSKSKISHDAEKLAAKKKPANPLEEFRNQYKGKAIMGKRAKGKAVDETDLLKSLASFKGKLEAVGNGREPMVKEHEGTACTLHGLMGCKSCKPLENDDGDDSGWISHALHFKRESANVYEPTVNDYSYFDPRDSSSVMDKRRDNHERSRGSGGRNRRDEYPRDRDRDYKRGRN